MWNIWDRRQSEATLPPTFFAYYVNYDPDRFETINADWSLKLHMNTVRIYQTQIGVQLVEEFVRPYASTTASGQGRSVFFNRKFDIYFVFKKKSFLLTA